MKWFKPLGILILGFVLIATGCGSPAVPLVVGGSSLSPAAGITDPGPIGIPDTAYTRLVAEAVQRGDLYLPRIPGKFAHIRVRKVLPPEPVQVEFWLGAGNLGSQRIEQDSTGTVKTNVIVQGKTATTHNFLSGWSDEMTLDSEEVALRLVEGDLWGFHRALLTGQARVIEETADTIVVRVAQEDSTAGLVEATLDRKTHLPLSVRQRTLEIGYEYVTIQVSAEGPFAVEAPPVRSTIIKMSLADARRFTRFPLYYVGEAFSGYQLKRIQYTYQDLRMSRDINHVGFFYFQPERQTGEAPVYVVVEPKSEEVLNDLAERAQAGLVGTDGQIGQVPTGHILTLAILDDAVVWLYGPDEATVRFMRQSLRPLR
ncbi:MAG: hypothetical protein ACE5JU_24670 [Candidatus Binatia bacterium]